MAEKYKTPRAIGTDNSKAAMKESCCGVRLYL